MEARNFQKPLSSCQTKWCRNFLASVNGAHYLSNYISFFPRIYCIGLMTNLSTLLPRSAKKLSSLGFAVESSERSFGRPFHARRLRTTSYLVSQIILQIWRHFSEGTRVYSSTTFIRHTNALHSCVQNRCRWYIQTKAISNGSTNDNFSLEILF